MEIILRLPFAGAFPVTFPFGAIPENAELKEKYKTWGLVGHNGIDYGLPVGTNVLAAAEGTVMQSGENGDFGISVTLEHPWGTSIYAHLSETIAHVGTTVNVGDLLGRSGQTGNVTGPHLHLGIKPANADEQNGYLGYIDPSPYLEKEVVKEVPVVDEQEIEKRVEEGFSERFKQKVQEQRGIARAARMQRKTDDLNKILQLLQKRKAITNADVRDLLHISQSAATKYLGELLKQGKLKKEGRARATQYVE